MNYSARFWIDHLQLTHHIEGGSFREVYRSSLMTESPALPAVFKGQRNFCTSIYFLLEQNQFSAFHKIQSDETWHYYTGDSLLIYEINEGILLTHRLGKNPVKGESFHCVIKAGNWFASVVEEGGSYALAGCTVSPGFDFTDFELADRTALSNQYPQYSSLIHQLTRT